MPLTRTHAALAALLVLAVVLTLHLRPTPQTALNTCTSWASRPGEDTHG